MGDLVWQPALATGHGAIDEEHRSLVASVGRLQAAVAAGQGRAEVEGTLTFLRDYVVSHFAREETLMLRHGFPGASAHLVAHADLVLGLSDLLAGFRAGRTEVTGEVAAFLEVCMLRHIAGPDQDLGRYLKNRGVAE